MFKIVNNRYVAVYASHSTYTAAIITFTATFLQLRLSIYEWSVLFVYILSYVSVSRKKWENNIKNEWMKSRSKMIFSLFMIVFRGKLLSCFGYFSSLTLWLEVFSYWRINTFLWAFDLNFKMILKVSNFVNKQAEI